MTTTTFTIHGVVREKESGTGIGNLMVKAYDRDGLYDDLMGSTVTNPDGTFEIVSKSDDFAKINPDDFRDFFEKRPDIYLRIMTYDGKRKIYSTENSVRWNAGFIEYFEVDIPRDVLGDLAPRRDVVLVDEIGEERHNFDVGESLAVRIEGIRPDTTHEIVILDNGEELFTNRLRSNTHGIIETTTLWPQMGLEDPRTSEPIKVEEAMERWKGRKLQLEIRTDGKAVMTKEIQFAAVLERPLLLNTDEEGYVRNGFVAGEQNVTVSGYNVPFEGRARIYMVPRQQNWQPGDTFQPVRLASERPAYVDVNIDESHHFQERLAQAGELDPGAYDFIVRQVRYGYEDDEDFVLRTTDMVTRTITGLVVQEEFMASKFALGGCTNVQQMAGRRISGQPYFQFADTFQVGEDIYAALDPAAIDPNLIGNMVALYVVEHKSSTDWSSDTSLNHLAVLGGNPVIFKTQPGCINYNEHLIWTNASIIGEYDIVADFGNNTPDQSLFNPDDSFDSPSDIIDGYAVAGFRIVQDPTTDTQFKYHGELEYDESVYKSKTVISDSGNSVTVPLRAVVRFPADIAGATTAGQISLSQAPYPLIVFVHGQGHDYRGYNYLLDHWAENGFIAASIHLENAWGLQEGSDRALILFEHLTILKNIFGTNVADNIGIMGHSRGGEGVTIAPRLNHQQGLGHAINAVIALAPTNQYTNETLGGDWATPYLVIYGAMDGDVDGSAWIKQPWHFGLNNCGFALYDKANGQIKSMIFVYGATHDRFTAINPDTDITASWSSLGPSDFPSLINADAHQKIAKAYSTAWFRWHLKDETHWQSLFRGEWIPAAVKQADSGKVKLYVQYEDTTRTEVDNFEGVHTDTSWQTSTIGDSVSDDNTLPVLPGEKNPMEEELYNVDSHSPHQTSGLLLRWDGTTDRLRFDIPSGYKNVSTYNAISFRVTQKVDSTSNPANQAQDLYLTCKDTSGKSRSIKVSKFAEIPAPQLREDNSLTKSAMCTVRIPLHTFEIEVAGIDKIDLENLESLTFDFKAKPTGEIEIDSVEFTE